MSKQVIALSVILAAGATLAANDWPEWRGPRRDGTSTETNLPSRWSPSGDNVAWSLNFGGRSTPVVFGNRLYLQTTTTGDVSTTQERLVAVDVDSGKVVWERAIQPLPLRRAAGPRGLGIAGRRSGHRQHLHVHRRRRAHRACSRWQDVVGPVRLPEEYGAITTHGGRTTSPIVEGDKVILNTLLQNWGPDLGRPGNRYFAFDKRTGQTMWVSSPQARHYDTNYSTPIVADVNGSRLLIVGGTDGVFHAIQVNTGKPVWSLEVSKRAILNSVVFRDNTVYISHGEENIDTTEMGMVAAMDATGSGVLTGKAIKWVTRGFLPTYSSPVMDNERLYSVDNSAILGAFDLKTGTLAWQKTLGTLQKGSPVLADGKLYIGTENGKFYILRPTATGAEVVDEDLIGTAADPEPIVASPIVADGRIYVVSMPPPTNPATAGHVYAIGTRRKAAVAAPAAAAPPAPGDVAQAQVFPYEAVLDPGQKQAFTLKLYDAKGNFIRNEPAASAQWTLDAVQGTIGPDGTYVAPASGGAGFVKATIGQVTAQARVRVIPPLPWTYDFTADKGADGVVDGEQQDVDRSGRERRPARPSARRHRRPSSDRADGPARLVRLHRRSGRARHRVAPAARRRRTGQSALRAGALRQRAEARAASVAGRRRDDRARAVHVGREHVVSHEVARRESAGQRDARSGQGVAGAANRSRPRGRSRRPTRSRTEPARQASTATASRTCCSTTSGSTRTSSCWSEERNAREACSSSWRSLCSRRGRRPAQGRDDWPMWGGSPDRNMVSDATGLPTTWDVKTGKNVKWVASLGSQSYGNPVVAERRRARRHEQRERARSEAARRSRRADGVPRVDRRVHVAGDVREAVVGPRQRLAVPGHRVVAAGRSDDNAYFVSNRARAHRRRHAGLPRQRERRPVQGREADRQDRRRHPLDVRHDGGGRQLSAQPRQLVAGRVRESDLRLDRQRAGRESREHPVAEGAGDRRHRHRTTGKLVVGGRVARRQDPARPVVDARRRHDRRRGAGRARPGRRLGARLRGEDPARSSGSSTPIRRTRSGRRRATK